jgi:hypothetical protein
MKEGIVCEACGAVDDLGTVSEGFILCRRCSPLASLPPALYLALMEARDDPRGKEAVAESAAFVVASWFASLPPLAEFGESDAEGPRRVAVAVTGSDFFLRSCGLSGRREAEQYAEELNSLFQRWLRSGGKLGAS